MKKYLPKLIMFILVLSMALGLGSITAFAYSEEELTQITEYYFQAWQQTDFQQFIDQGAAMEMDEAAIAQYTGWEELKGQIGTYEETVETRVEEEEDTIVVTLIEKYTNGNLQFTITFDKATAEQDAASAIMEIDAALAVADSGAATMAKAAMNTFMGMGIVVLVLIFISLIIGLLKYVPAFFDKKKEEERVEPSQSAPVPVASAAASASTSAGDDTELIAVITAAIMALRAEEDTGVQNGFVVRSIRRRRS